MGQAPRLPEIRLPLEKRIIYFVTWCVKDRRNVLANPDVFEAIKATITQLPGWHILAGVVMPDHAHWIVGPRLDWEFQLVIFQTHSSGFWAKRWLNRIGNGSAGVLIDCCAPMRTCTANGFTCKTIQCVMVWCKEQTIGHTIWISLMMKKIICRGSCQLPVLRTGEAGSFPYRAGTADGVRTDRRGVVRS